MTTLPRSLSVFAFVSCLSFTVRGADRPPDWDPALAGDLVMERLICVTAPQVKGAHDAEMAIVGERAYVVAEVNDVRAGEAPGWPEIYLTLSIVHLKTLTVERIIPFAQSEQSFSNVTLPRGSCFVPRILAKNDRTLRCYFAMEHPGKGEAQTWYLDFDIPSGTFETQLHKAQLKTAAGTFDMQPQHFHADAAAQGFPKPAKDYGLYLFDSFKAFGGKTYVALNNYPIGQNALAFVHDDLATFEVLGHYNQPHELKLTESAINRLPDGTWMAICRQDGGTGNYTFTTSSDGKTWTRGEHRAFVPNGTSSKPTFDKIGDLYYIGWQESTRIHGVSRSVFNIDVSRDCATWERKYRFESVHSFQYPTFRAHAGAVWLCATQGDTDVSRKERIMFGKLEDVGEYASQAGKTRKALPPPPPKAPEAPAVMVPGVTLFTDREYVLNEIPEPVRGLPFLRTSIEATDVECTAGGTLYALSPTPRPGAASQQAVLLRAGFTKVAVPEAQLFPGEVNRVSLYRREVKTGTRLKFRKLVLLVMGEGTALKTFAPTPPQPWTANKGERLYNGIVLPEVWPPNHLEPASREPMPVPYLQHPPETISIDLGRQLFVDDFLIAQNMLKRTFHSPKKYAGNPVFKSETGVELRPAIQGERGESAMNFTGQGGVFYDPAERHFKMFYVAGWRGPLSLATSRDMVHWERPELGLAGGNALLPQGLNWTGPQLKSSGSDNCLWLDLNAATPAERIKFMVCWHHVPKDQRPPGFDHSLHVSDGRTWSDATPTGMADDYCSFFYNPFRQKWCYSIKQGGTRGRSRWYAENVDFLKGADWSDSVYWTNADRLDAAEPVGRYPGAGEAPQLYSLNAVAYESLMVGMHYIHRGPKNEICDAGRFPKLVDLEVGFSRDGFHWDRPDRGGFITGSRTEGTWDRGYLHSTAGMFVVLEDQLVFPYMGTSGIAPNGARGMYTGGSIGLAMLRRDGFASMDAASESGTLTTRPVVFSGSHLFVNVAAPKGSLHIELLDASDKVVATSIPVSSDHTKQRIDWQSGADLAAYAGKPMRFRFHLTDGSLYAFWVSADAQGASNGYLGAGGPGFSGVRDVAR